MKPTAKLIMHPPGRHLAQGKQRHPEGRFPRLGVCGGSVVGAEKKIKRHRPRELWRAAKSALPRIVTTRDLLIGGIDQPGVNFPRSLYRRGGSGTSQRRHDLV